MTQKKLGIHADSNINSIQGPRVFSHVILWTATLFIIIAFFWSKYAILDEVTTGQGKVIPSSQIQVIQNLEGGIVRKIYVREGEIVKKNQVLMQIDDTRFAASYKEALKKIDDFEIEIARLNAEIENKPFIISDKLKKANLSLYKAEKALYDSRINEYKQLEFAKNLAERELKLTKPLVNKGAVSEVEVLRLQRTVNELNGKIYSFKSKTLEQLNKARGELNALKESYLAHRDRLVRTTVRSPVKGIIKQIKINTVGGVVQPGMDILEIVPLDDTLLIEAKIRPSDIGFIHPGQKTMVKLTAYDFSIYGGLEGKVEQISADTITNEKDESFYIIRVRTKKNYLGTKQKPLYIIPGMLSSVDILTGRKSVLDYLLKPILKAKQAALRER
jgi:membrane fusion protein, adhesin transport system